MRLALFALFASLAFPPAAGASDAPASAASPADLAANPAAPAATAPPKDAPFEMERFQLVLLVRAPSWRKLPEEEAKALQAAHLGHLTRMWEANKAVVCGPFGDQLDAGLRGACIYDVKDAAEARALAEADPIVKAGQLRIETVTWWVGKGYMTFPKRPPSSAK
jgi:uncharacterized protein YciI